MTQEEISVESAKTVAESILARMPSGERTVKFHGLDLKLKDPPAMALVDARSRSVVACAADTAKMIAKAKKGKGGKKAIAAKIKELKGYENEKIIQRAALIENAMVLKACADAADPEQLAAFTEDQLFKAVLAEGPLSEAVMAATELSQIREVDGVPDPFGSPEPRESG